MAKVKISDIDKDNYIYKTEQRIKFQRNFSLVGIVIASFFVSIRFWDLLFRLVPVDRFSWPMVVIAVAVPLYVAHSTVIVWFAAWEIILREALRGLEDNENEKEADSF